MGFETVVLAHVAEVLGTDVKAEFAHGSLFILDITPDEAVKIWKMLRELTSGPVDMGHLGDEVYYDFVG
jgi:hypothetical protein